MKANTLVESVGDNGTLVGIRRYIVGGKEEFRFAWRDSLGKRHFKCSRTLEEAKLAAKDMLTGRWPVEKAHANVAHDVPAHGFNEPGKTQKFRSFGEVCDEYLLSRKGKYERNEIRIASYRDNRSRVPGLKSVLGGLSMNQIDVRILDNALLKFYGRSARSLWNFRNQLRSILLWAVARNEAPESVLKAFQAMEVTGSKDKSEEKIDPFTPEEVATILEAARSNSFDPTSTPFRMMAAVALQAFGGIRAAESCRMLWEQIDLENAAMRVRRVMAKVKRTRTVPMTANLVKWLRLVPAEFRHGPIYSTCAYSKAQGRLARRVAKKLPNFRWRGNGLRAAFISHFCRFSDSMTDTAFQAGTSEQRIKDNYWKLVTEEAAQAYFEIEPLTEKTSEHRVVNYSSFGDWSI